MTEKNKSIRNFPNSGNVPKLRFSEFTEDWEKRKLGEVAEIGRGKSKHRPRDAEFLYGGNFPFIQTGDIRKADLYLTEFTQTYSDAGLKQSKLWNENTLCITIAANIAETAILKIKACFPDSVIGLIPKENKTLVLFVKHLFDKFKIEIQNLSQGAAQDNLNQEKLSKIEFSFPEINEQEKIATFLSHIDERIISQKKIIEVLRTLKIQTRNKLIIKIIKDDYEPLLIKDILTYEQPTKYIVTSTDYSSDKTLIPVLTANKAFILGYIDENFGIYDKGNCIILDDFTMDLKYVDFSFKVKSSAIKILTAKEGVNLKYIFEYFSFLNFSSSEHKRHYISEIEPMSVVLPPLEIQNKIANYLSKIDEKLKTESEIYDLFIQQKKYLLANLFV
ncbi:restriction endonuclease subunit S [Chryseobacterium limigenitum]|uniref:Type I restriction enzyme, S subunit n=1 Tax=Chryseobacterium limigenitum TaxID=1612149 RepID=A0A1K2IXF6_9FLAO|nr:restriction endonuclease subunit S [Chryseobacterium limigenitum]SFZ96880.1 type I restriction enzyme, S subunit [Chryseobacterium limigenitum]